MADKTPLTPRPQVRSTGTQVGYEAAARTVDQGAGIRPAPDSSLVGLVEGLSALNPGLQKWSQAEQIREDTAFNTQAAKAHEAGTAAAERDRSGLPLDLNPAPDAGFEGTFKTIHVNAYRQGIANRGAAAAQAAIVAEYGEKKDLPDFNLEQFIAQQRKTNLQGLDDDMTVTMGRHLDKLEASLRQDYDGIRLKRLDETRESNISATLRTVLTPDAPEAIVQKYQSEVLPVILGMGKTRKEGAEYLLRHLITLSDKAGGQPELFDTLLTQKDAAGLTIFDANPKLQGAIASAKAHALAARDRAVADAAADGNLLYLKGLDEQIVKNPHAIQFDDLVANFGRHGAFKSDNEVISTWNRVLKAREEKAQSVNLLDLARVGQLYIADEKDQKKVMEALTGTVVEGLSRSISSGDTSGVAGLSGALIDAHRAAGSTVPSGPIERMFKFIGTATPSPDSKPAPIFSAAAEVYRALEAKPELREVYFDEAGRKVMKAYVAAVEGGAEPGAAYKSAYAAISPEAKAREEAYKKTPAYAESLQKATKWVTGSSFWPRILGGSGRPENGGQVVGIAQDFALNYVRTNPQATDEDVQAATQAHMAKSMVLDPNTRVAVKVPAGVAPEMMQKSVEAYTKAKMEEFRIKDREDGWSITMIPVNINQGTYRVATSFNGAPVHFIEEVTMGGLVDSHRKATMFLPEDAKVLKEAQLAFDSGKAYTNPALQSVVAKARALGVQPDLVKKIDAQQMQFAKDTLGKLPRFDAEVDTQNLYKNDRIQNSPKMTVGSAQRLLNSGGLAASLITMGEGVVLQAYDDPAQGAGKNIGMGYNLKANAAVAERDLRAAGVPAERIPSIIDGTGKLSPEQAERLTMVAVGRYEQMAQGQVNAVQPRLWERLQPQQRAVLTDIAYQTGNVGQFKTAIGKLVSGDMAGFAEASKVHYTNRSGERVEDKRRNALRNAMLSGTQFWQSVLVRSGGQPSTALDAVALAQ